MSDFLFLKNVSQRRQRQTPRRASPEKYPHGWMQEDCVCYTHTVPQFSHAKGGKPRETERERTVGETHTITRLRSTGTLKCPLLSTVIIISPSKHDPSRENKYLEDKKALWITYTTWILKVPEQCWVNPQDSLWRRPDYWLALYEEGILGESRWVI